jgi:hypothetical protein
VNRKRTSGETMTNEARQEFRRIRRDIKEARCRLGFAESPEPAETHAEARKRLVSALLALSWSIHTVGESGYRRKPELRHPSKPYALNFRGRGVQQNGFPTSHDCRGWSLERLMTFCDERSTGETRKDLAVRKALAESNAGVPGIPHDLVFKHLRERLAAWHDESRKRLPPVPVFRSEAAERAFWASHDVLDYFGESDLFDDDDDCGY